MINKPVLVGMNNPQGNEPLWPHPAGCTGHRIWRMLTDKTGASMKEYISTFERINVCDGTVWNQRAALGNREVILRRLGGRTAVLLGRPVPKALGLPAMPWLVPKIIVVAKLSLTLEVINIPHPSGLCHWYNDYANKDLVGNLLAELYTNYRSSVGLPVSERVEA
jgi:hypothetical protein